MMLKCAGGKNEKGLGVQKQITHKNNYFQPWHGMIGGKRTNYKATMKATFNISNIYFVK